jgi:putative cofactor-binding repeat protein
VLAGSTAAYISADVGSTNGYDNTSTSVVHFWRDVTIPVGQTDVTLTFNWAANGEVTENDALMVSVAPVSYMPVASTSSLGLSGLASPANTLGQFWKYSVGQPAILKIPVSVLNNCSNDGTFRLIFTWKNNETSGSIPSASIDNISMISDAPPPLSGTYSIGPSGNCTSLTAATAAINARGVSNPLVLELQGSYVSTVETFPLVLAGQANCYPPTSTNTVTIRPAAGAGARSITGSSTNSALIDINGGMWWTINGLNSGGASLTTSSGVSTTSGVLCGINLTGAGDINIGTVTGNTIGASIRTGSLTAIPGTTQGTLVGIHSSSTGTVNISNNLMGALTSAATGATIAGGIIAVNISGTAAAALTIANNIIGNATADNIRAGVSGTTTGSSVCSGIYINANPVVATVSGNTIRNLSSFVNGTAGYARGIWTVNTTNGSSINWTISNNTIDNIKTNASTIGFANGLCSAQGIHLSAAPGCTISGNTVSNISNTSTAPANIVVGGIGISASALSTSQIIDVSRNNIRALSNSASSATSSIPSTIFGIGIRAANNQVLVSNNMIS